MDLKWARGGFGPRFFERNSAISTGAPGRFEVHLFADKKLVAFSVSGNPDGAWQVVELGRTDASDTPETVAQSAAFPPLRYLGEFKPAGDSNSASPLAGLWDFTFDSRGRIYVVLKKKGADFSMGLLDENGAVVQEQPLAQSTLAGMGRHWVDVPRYKDDRYFQFRKEGESGYSAWSVDLATRKEEPLRHFPGGIAMSISRLSDGSLVVLDAYDQRYSPAARLRYFDPNGKLRWELRSDVRSDYEVLGFGPNHLTVTTQDNVVLLSNPSIQILDINGKHLKKIELKGAFGDAEFGGDPGYLHEVVADAVGGFLVANARNPPVVLRYSDDGSLRSMWSPRHPDGKTFDLRPKVRVAPDGRLWTGDGSSIMRLTDDGVVDLVIGEKPSDDQLREIVAFTVDLHGNMYAVAHGSGTIHVFDPQGKPIRVIKPNPADVQGTVKESFIAVNDRGEVFLKKPATRVFMPPDEYLRFSPSGEYIETITFEPSIPVGQFLSPGWAFQPKTNYRCGIYAIGGDNRLVLVDPPKTLIREQRKRPNGQWFGDRTTIAVAPDGSIAVLDQDILAKDGTFELDFFSPQGDPLHTVQLPHSQDRYTGLTHDGSRVAVFGNKNALILDVLAGKMSQWALVAPGVTEKEWAAFAAPQSKEIFLFDKGKQKVHRYQLPE